MAAGHLQARPLRQGPAVAPLGMCKHQPLLQLRAPRAAAAVEEDHLGTLGARVVEEEEEEEAAGARHQHNTSRQPDARVEE
mmetsp:Transcript_2899/g.6337  ORF Transcript_2899/g.6337 Transcript_2899/m.6337 type:complete len:81 (+) Transcript_2899:180-422(+)